MSRPSEWEVCIGEAFSDAGIEASDDQINTVAAWAEGLHENWGMYTGRDCIPDPRESEIQDLKRELEREVNKSICPECKSRGRLFSQGPVHSSDSGCWKCNGTGFIY